MLSFHSTKSFAMVAAVGLAFVGTSGADPQVAQDATLSAPTQARVYYETDKDRPLGMRQPGHEIRDGQTGFYRSPAQAFRDLQSTETAESAQSGSTRFLNTMTRASRGAGAILTQNDRWSWGLEDDQRFNFGLDAQTRAQLLTSETDTPEADLKIGPLYFDLRWLELTANHYERWSSTGQHISEDQLLASVAIESTLKVHDTLHFNFFSNLSYDFINERFYGSALAGTSAGSFIGSYVHLAHQIERWEVSLLQQFRGFHYLNLHQNVWFENGSQVDDGGFHAQDSVEYLEDSLNHRSVVFQQGIQAAAGREVLDEQWYLSFQANHHDYWQSFDFTDHTARQLYRGEFAYRGSKLLFAPELYYEALSYTGGDWLHRTGINVSGRLLESVTIAGTLGYSFSDQREFSGTFWEAQLRHQFSLRGWQSLSFGQGFEDETYLPITTFQSYARYSLGHQVTDYTHLGIFYQWTADSQTWDSGVKDWGWNEQSQHSTGITYHWRMSQDSQLQNGVYVNLNDDSMHYSYFVQTSHRLTDRVSANLYYRMDQYESEEDHSAHHVGLTLRKTF